MTVYSNIYEEASIKGSGSHNWKSTRIQIYFLRGQKSKIKVLTGLHLSSLHPSEAPGLPGAFWCFRCSLASGCITPISASLKTWTSILYLFFLSLLRTLRLDLGPAWIIQDDFILITSTQNKVTFTSSETWLYLLVGTL